MSDETFDDVWHEMGCSASGIMSWHSVKPMLHKLIQQEEILAAEQRVLAEER